MLFAAAAVWLVAHTVLTNLFEAAAGLALIALGLPVYFYYRRKGLKRVSP